MPDLTVTLRDGRGTLSLVGHDIDAPEGSHHATITDTIQNNVGTAVYRADTELGERIYKFAFCAPEIEKLEKERLVYTESLKSLQGSALPRYYGFYRGTDEAGREAACIEVEAIGRPLCEEGRLSSFPLHDRYKIIEQLGKVHSEGLLPMFDLGGGDVARCDDGFRMINFQGIESHECPWDGNWHTGEDTPELDEFKCAALYEVGLEMGIWKPHQYPIVQIGDDTYLDMPSEVVAHEIVAEDHHHVQQSK